MLFPDDGALCRNFAVQAIAAGPLKEAIRQGFEWEPYQGEFIDNFELGRPTAAQVQEAQFKGYAVGAVIHTLWGLICERPSEASISLAVLLAENLATEHKVRAGKSFLRRELSRLSPVAHFWGAWAMRGGAFRADPTIGYSNINDLDAFVMEAMTLHGLLTEWRDNHPRAGQKVITDDVFQPWETWEPLEQRPEWPPVGAIYPTKLIAKIPWPRPAGRPKRKSVQRKMES